MRSDNLKNHMNVCKDRPHTKTCDWCSKKVDKKDAKQHMEKCSKIKATRKKKENEKRRVECEHCPRIMSKRYLQAHMLKCVKKKNERNGKQECTTCGSQFSNASNLARHCREQHPVRKFACENCEKEDFESFDTLEVHEFECWPDKTCSVCHYKLGLYDTPKKHRHLSCSSCKQCRQPFQSLEERISHEKTCTGQVGRYEPAPADRLDEAIHYCSPDFFPKCMPGRAYEKEQLHQFLFGQKTKTGLFMLWGTHGTGKTAVVRLSTQAYLRTKPSARVIKVYGNDIKAEISLLTNLAISLTG